ncbi:Dyp-type peroxidase [Ruania alba]|uniref:Dye decolorizing peroxidase n=1 Tax=Ruania alba TaxID=648782 RepID=A0A1H5BQ75_9MICO|nr:Dyp-type peroxidase [Ruania alba]SED56516.1 dye decolorizing peroxidase [Ruania alba]
MSDSHHGPSRRQALIGSAVVGWGAAAALGIDRVATARETPTATGSRTVPFHGRHQTGVTVPPQAHAAHVALDLLPETDLTGIRRMMRLLSDDAARLTQGRPALGDTERELAHTPSALTITFGFGRELVTRAGGPVPDWLSPLPAFEIDRLTEAWSGGDLLLLVAADDPVAVAHAVRMLSKDARQFASVRWVQHGFRNARGSTAPGTTMRNLFGQVDGTVNPAPGTAEFDQLVWHSGGWLDGGTSVVIRRIAMDLDGWDRVARVDREGAVGRRLDNGAPITGTREHDDPDFDAVDERGFPVIAEYAHIRRARSPNVAERFLRRGYNYDDPPPAGQLSDSGLIFVAMQADPVRQFVPVQRRLDDLDLLNEWTTPVGSAVFAIPPGCADGGYIGETLLG